MRKALALAAFLAMAPYAQAQEGTGSFSHNAEYRVRYQYDNNVTGNESVDPTSQSDVKHRFKLGTTFKNSDKLSTTLTLLHNATWGADPVSTGDGEATYSGTSNGENMLLVQEAYGTWMVSDEFTLKFGRGSIGFGDGTLIAENDWEATPYAFEGVLGTYEMEVGRLNAYYVRFSDYATSTIDQDPEANSYGFMYSHKALPEFLKRADVHLLKNEKSITTTLGGGANDYGQDLLRYGISLGGDFAMIDWRGAYNAQSGDYVVSGVKHKGDSNMFEIELGANFEEFMKSRVYVLYHQDTGDDDATDTKEQKYSPFYYDLHSNAGLMDIYKWGNLTDIAIGYTMEPMDATTVGLQYHMFKKTKKGGSVSTGINGGNFGTTDAAKDDLGSEIDLVSTHSYDNGLMITGRLGMFMPGDAYANTTTKREDTYTTAFVEAKMNF